MAGTNPAGVAVFARALTTFSQRKAPGEMRGVNRLSPWCRADGHPSLSERLGYEVSDLIRISCVSCGFTRTGFVNYLM